MAELLAAIGDDPTREGLVDTPDRVARMYQDLFSGIGIYWVLCSIIAPGHAWGKSDGSQRLLIGL